jgi:four helix bundle protein
MVTVCEVGFEIKEKVNNFLSHHLNFTVMKTYSFENLDVWQCSRKLAVFIYSITTQFPHDEKFGLVSQMRRAAISICSNLAEGSAKHTGKEKARFTETAFGSLMELLNQGIISCDLEFVKEETLQKIRLMIDEIAGKTSRLRETQLLLK